MSRPSAEAAASGESTWAGPGVVASTPTRVRRRHVFYISGFDPQGPARYHRLYNEQAGPSAALGGYQVDVGKRRKGSAVSALWSVRYRDLAPSPSGSVAGGMTAEVATEVEFLRWDDIVRDHWPRNPAVLAWDLVRTTWLYLHTGALWQMFKLSWPPVVALVTPFLMLLGLVLSLPVAAVGGWWLARVTGNWYAGFALAEVLLIGIAGLAVIAERRLNMQWILRSYAFTGLQGTRGCAALEARLDVFAQAIAEQMQRGTDDIDNGCDEVLIAAHSSGGIMAIAALARAFALDGRLAQHGPRLSLLTMGQWSPLLSSLPSSHTYRRELARLSREPDVDWVDFTAPPDGCCFALTHPVTAAGLPASRPDHPRLLSPRFAAMFSSATYADIKRDRFRLHMQYLMAGEIPGDYDYTAITAGPLRLGERYAGQASLDGFKKFRLFG